MNSRLIIIEGLPGFGKSTTAKIVELLLKERNIKTKLFLEGNLDHPADYDGVSVFNKKEYDELLFSSKKFKDLFNQHLMKKGENYFLPYRKIENELNMKLPEEVFDFIFKKDIYEIPLEQNMKLIQEKWKEFTEVALNNNQTYIFECCFIQNPLTIGMVKYNSLKEKVMNYVMRLAEIIQPLNPLLIYIEQNDLEDSFRKAIKERPREWSEGFIDYYVNQGYGKKHGFKGVEGTLQVLKARKNIELDIFDRLEMKKMKINNSKYETHTHKLKLLEILDTEIL
ncbi:P-loop NTPase family protein [Chengkuizengella marina]|uniref:Group-specific protein n=1 Tax=Chengkuizengella marina TaxID=2507566 RepID=A0A6N9Q7Z4_9BACL|nr:hypothetical protein [Chengkuizengella marina]NBI30870.1 hypothetical protein [Chengkuizengella marina]